MDEERKARQKKMVATKRLKLAMEMDEIRKTRLEKMVTTTQRRLALETEEERKAKKMDWIQIGFKKIQWEPFFYLGTYHLKRK